MNQYLESSKYVDWEHPKVSSQAQRIAKGLSNNSDIARACFKFVRDEIKHSFDYQLNPITLKASEVLEYGTGYCFAKSHLLAALLRANSIPAGLCYQRLMLDSNTPSYCLHGLNAVYLEQYGWYRIDARGNKPGVITDFTPPVEQLAFSTSLTGEIDLPEVWAEPLDIVVQALVANHTFEAVAENLPDVEIFERIP